MRQIRPIWPALFSAFVGPGTGQILNGELKKGALLLVTSLGSFLWFSKVVGERLSMVLSGTPDQWKLNPEQMRVAITALVHESPGMFITFHVLMLMLWIFGIVDAYSTAKFRIIKKNSGRDDE